MLTPWQIKALQIKALTPEQIKALTPEQIKALTPEQIRALIGADVKNTEVVSIFLEKGLQCDDFAKKLFGENANIKEKLDSFRDQLKSNGVNINNSEMIYEYLKGKLEGGMLETIKDILKAIYNCIAEKVGIDKKDLYITI